MHSYIQLMVWNLLGRIDVLHYFLCMLYVPAKFYAHPYIEVKCQMEVKVM